MGLFDKIKELAGIDDDFLDDDYEDEEEEKSIIPDKEPERIGAERASALPRPPVRSEAQPPKPTINTAKFTNQIKLVVIEPAGFEDSPRLVDNLKAKKPVIINLENLETDIARKIFDFLSGATYALNGNVQKVANNIFIFAPENCDVAYNMHQKPGPSETIRSPWK